VTISPDPDVIAEDIADDLRTALEEIEGILDDLKLRREAILSAPHPGQPCRSEKP
jgi:hypothetical protein